VGEHRHTVPSPSPPAMEALVATSLGDPATVVRHEAAHPRPALGRGAVRVAVAAASLNFADLLQVGERCAGGARAPMPPHCPDPTLVSRP